MRNKGVVALGLALVGTLALGGCAAGSSDDGDDVTIEWWHIQTQEPTRGVWQELADEFEAAHPGVTIDITVQNDPEFKTGIDARAQAGDLPDIYQTWGGGVLGAQVDAGLVQDLSESTSGWIDNLAAGAVAGLQIDGKQYGVPYDSGLVGVWYNKALFAQAGIDAVPTTWEEFMSAVKALRAAGVTPLALGAGDKWPAMFYWAEGGLAEGGSQPFIDAGETGDFTADAFIKAGERIDELVAANAFQDGFLGTAYAEAGGASSLIANGQAAMELMGSWSPGTQASVAENGEGLGDDLGWFPYPLGTSTDEKVGFGGINGFAVGKDAPPETIEFLEFILSTESQKKLGAAGQLLPVANGAEDSIENPYQRQIRDALVELDYLQVFLDQAYAPAVGTAINDNVQAIFAGTLTPQAAAEAITQVAQAQ
ncbi:extracellular solute-binding protein [Microbacterium atlanticum]|uniref:extracellular solute-binding protein n=1 Tax=Microbacterium atlanticum TaxID=2782168 RepID=UPI0018895BB5|nr:extracellular solute-binding protein [Microbacterium atlanticum]